SRIRGGHNTFAIRAGTGEIHAPKERADVLVALNDETVALHRSDLAEGALVIADESFPSAAAGALKVPYKELASGRYVNTAALGVVAAALGLDLGLVRGALGDQLGKKDADVARANVDALDKAYDWFASSGTSETKGRPLARVADPRPRLALNGNEAIALGAASAGVKFCAFYPMTPSTSIPLTLAAHAEKLGLVVEQAEDEIAAINMAIGASFAGAASMVATSGGGFALMTEGVSLAAMTETPVVIAIAQRPGPATGLPTRTEQGDLEFVLHAGHGEFPRAVFAPGTVEGCFHLTRKAFELAERVQGPVFVLTDQFLADSTRAVEPFDIDGLEPVAAPEENPAFEKPYRRFAFTESGVSPRLMPGRGEPLVCADSDEHDEGGHITEDLSLRNRMVEKRLKKGEILREEALGPGFAGDEGPELLLVSWGSTGGAVLEAAGALRARGKSTAALHFDQVWPLDPAKFLHTLEEAGEVVCVEGNATGQFARLVRRETGFDIARRVLRYDGLPLTPEFVLRGLEASGLI
ncbi:MAG: 2-oxoacid:acceptor oxidoreductase subunit alpha, partial [Planctomycetota bacterium]